MTTKYKILFMVELLHEYYRSLQSNDFTVVPSAETIQLLKNRQMLYKLVGNKLVVLVKVSTEVADLDQPFIELEANKKFIFYLELNKPLFTTITNLDTDRLRLKHRYYFNNIHQNKAGDSLHLSKKIADYDNAATYFPGDFVDDGGGQVFECIRHTTGGNNTGAAGFWRLRGTEQFVSAADMLPFVTRNHRYQATVPAKEFTIRVFGFNTVTGLYDKEIKIANSTYTSNQPASEIPASLTEVPPGRYRIQINTDEFDVWVDDTAVYRNMFGVIEIFNHLPPASDFALLDAAGKVKDVVVAGVPQWLRYQVRFANRRAFWKYMTPRQGVSAITDNTGVYNFLQSPPLPAAADYFQSDHPILIHETPALYDLELNNPVSDEPPAAPNPDPNVTGMLTRSDPDKDYYCTIYLNY